MEIKNEGGEKPAIESNYGVRFYIDNMRHQHGTFMPYFHFHAFEYEFFYLKEGTKRYIIDDENYDIRDGDLIIIHPGEKHRSVSTDENPHYRLIIYLSEKSFPHHNELIAKYKIFDCLSARVISIPPRRRLEFDKLFDLISCFDNKQLSTELGMDRFEGMMFELLCRLGELRNEVAERRKNPLVDSAVAYLKANYRSNVTLKGTAEAIFTSPGHLSRVFSECMGQNFGEYLNELRLRQAISLLKKSRGSISEIAAASGFSSPNYMGEVFRRVIGVSPSEYRKLSVESGSVKHRPPDDPVNFQGYSR